MGTLATEEGVPLYLQIAESVRRRIAAGELAPGDRLPPVREMASEWGCTPGTVGRAYAELRREGLVVGHRGSGTRVAPSPLHGPATRLRWASLVNRAERYLLEALGAGHTPEEAQAALGVALARWQESTQSEPHAAKHVPQQDSLCFAGSHDLVVEQLAGHLQQEIPGLTLRVQYVGSLGGLMALARGEADLAGVHLWDETTDTYNAPYVARLLPGRRVALLTLAHRRLGLIIAPGNPLALQGLRDLARPGLRFVNRQRGSGTRVWLDAHLRAAGVDGPQITGYEEEETTHLGVARAVAEGHADVGLGIQAAALAYGLDFLPLTLERYDLVIPEEVWPTSPCRALVEVIRSPGFRAAVEAMGGYETKETGNVQWVP